MHAPNTPPMVDPTDHQALQDVDRANNLVELFLMRADEKGDAPFLGSKHDGEWRTQSWHDVADSVCLLAESLRAIGLNEDMQEAVWTLTKYFLSEYTEYLKDSNVEVVILCGINLTCKMKCEIPLATLFHKYKQVTGLDRFVSDSNVDEASSVNQFYSNVYLLLMKKFLKGDINDCVHRIEALYPVTPLKEILPSSPVS